jgi:hypothetical protein
LQAGAVQEGVVQRQASCITRLKIGICQPANPSSPATGLRMEHAKYLQNLTAHDVFVLCMQFAPITIPGAEGTQRARRGGAECGEHVSRGRWKDGRPARYNRGTTPENALR